MSLTGRHWVSISIHTHLDPIAPIYTRPFADRIQMGSLPNVINSECDHVWVPIADPNGFESVESRVNTRPVRYSLGTDPFGSDLM